VIVVTGASGFLGGHVALALAARGRPFRALVRAGEPPPGLASGVVRRLDLEDETATADLFAELRPEAVVHCAAEAAVAACAADPERARRLNVEVPARLASLCRSLGAHLVFVSTDMVFDGERAPYTEIDPTSPTTVYGTSKRDGELAVLAVSPSATVARLPLLYGDSATSRESFQARVAADLRAGKPVRLFFDEHRTPLEVRTAARRLVSLAESRVEGVVHLPGPSRSSRMDLGRELCAAIGADPELLVPVSRTCVPGEPRPRDLSLATVRDTPRDT
jgi:dTDP-4-dehydrorhamnose reductase